MTLREAQWRISSAEFAEWMAFYVYESEAAERSREPSPEALREKMAALAAAHRNRE